VEPLCRFAGRYLVKTSLCHHDGHVEARASSEPDLWWRAGAAARPV